MLAGRRWAPLGLFGALLVACGGGEEPSRAYQACTAPWSA